MADLTPEQIRLEEERLNLINKQNEAAKNLLSTYEKMSKSRGTMKKEDNEILDLTKQLSQITSNLSSSIQKRISGTSSIKDLTKSIKQLEEDKIKNQNLSITLQDKLTKKVESSVSNARQANKDLVINQQNLTAELEKNLKIQDDIDDLKRASTSEAKVLLALKRQELKDSKAALDVLEASRKKLEVKKQINIDLAHQAKDAAQAQKDSIEAQKTEIELSKKELNLKKLQEKKDEVSKALGLDKLGSALTFAGIFKQLLDFVLAADAQVTELAKSLGLSKDQARGIRDNFASYAKSTGDAFVTTKKLMEAQGDLTQELGVAGTYTGKQAEDFSRLTKLMGLSVGEAGKLARLSVINGTSIEDTTKSIIKGSFAAGRTNKLSVDQRTILKEVANLSEGILVKFQGNPEALGAAVVQAKALGLNLEQVDKIGDSLLDWESSIENELKAELITGKQINLEKARAAALTGDQAALAAEVASQVGNLNDFSKMNVIAQQSLAGAFGMNRDEMSKMLMDQEKFNRLGDVSSLTAQEQLALAKEKGISVEDSLYQSLQQQSIQEKFNNAIEKLQELVGNLVAGPLGTMLDMFVNLASNSGVMVTAMAAMGAISLVRTIAGLATMATTLGMSATAAITTASAVTLGIGIIAVIAGIASAMGAFDSAKDSIPKHAKGGIITKPQIGMIGEAGPEAIIPLNSSKAAGILGGGNNNDGIMNAINNLATSMSKPTPTPQFSLNVAGEQLGNVVGRQQETGTQQSKNTYKLA